MRERVNEIVSIHNKIVEEFFKDTIEDIKKAVFHMIDTVKKGNKIIVAGNGGSTSDALHMVTELIGKFYIERDPIPAIALSANPSILTEIGNDYDFQYVFSRQLEALGNKRDLFIAISTSGNSKNIIKALEVARRKGIYTIGLSGKTGGKMRELVDICFCVPSFDTPRIQEVHIMIIHILCEFLEQELYGEER